MNPKDRLCLQGTGFYLKEREIFKSDNKRINYKSRLLENTFGIQVNYQPRQ